MSNKERQAKKQLDKAKDMLGISEERAEELFDEGQGKNKEKEN